MADRTQFDPAAINAAAEAIGSIMNTKDSAFEALLAQSPDAGSFPDGNWLTGVIQERATALNQQKTDLDGLFSEMSAKLKEVATDLNDQDQVNASTIQDIEKLTQQIDGGLSA